MSEEPTSDKKGNPIDLAQVRISRNERGQLVLRTAEDAEPIENVRVTKCFPWSLRDRYVSIRDKDGNEQVLLPDLGGMSAETRRLIDQELDAQDFIPTITSVAAIIDNFGVMIWDVQTDRGPVELQIKTTDDIRRLDQRRVLLKDHAGGLFEIRDLAELDPTSQRLVEDNIG